MRWKHSIYILIISIISTSFGWSKSTNDTKVCSFSHLYFEIENGLIIIDATVNDVNGKFIFDTGLEGIILNGEANRADQIFETVGGAVKAQQVNIEKIKVGNLVKRNLTAYRSDLTAITNLINTQIHGMIGLSVMNEMLISIDYESRTMKLIPKVPFIKDIVRDKHSVPLIFQSEIPCIELVHDNTTMLFALDTGAGAHFIDGKSIKQEDVLQADIQVSSLSGLKKSSKAINMPMRVANNHLLDLDFKVLDFTEINNSLDKPINGILSVSQIFSSQIFIDPASGTLYF